MSDNQQFDDFIKRVESHSGRPMTYGPDVSSMVRVAAERSLGQVFSDAVFHATFVVKTQDIMKRIGVGADGFDTLSAQFTEGVERVSTLLRTLVKEADEETKQRITTTFLSMEKESLERLLTLMADLSLIKHWEVDGHPMPFGAQPSSRKDPTPGTSTVKQYLQNLTRAARLALVLLVIVCIFDGPFTILGWIAVLIVAGLLIVVQYEAAMLRKISQ